MGLTSGTRIGPYEVVSSIGAGGMGQVYRARDTKLGRDVAIKVLPELFAGDPERRARFAREAQLLASFNHPHIAGIYGLEESLGSHFLILEFVDGLSLAERLASGPLPVDEALAIAAQITEALEAAHEKGIVHRDLKPANIMLTAEGQVKVLDFGLARVVDADPGSSALNSPTLTFAATQAGVILGTAAYMAPEQAKGKIADKRADIWAFGVVLFEMLTGVRPFDGDTMSETIAAILKDPPAWKALPDGLPPALQSLIKRTLEKDPRQRLRDIGDARLALADIHSSPATLRITPTVPKVTSGRSAVPWVLALSFGVMAVVFATQSFRQRSAEVPLLKYTLPISGESLERTALPAISPDGRHVAFLKGATLWVRSLDQLEPRQLADTSGAQFPFWSPDSRQIAYLTANAVWRVGIDGSHPVRVATYGFQKGGRTPGGVWLPNDTLVFAPSATGSGLVAVPVQGGEFTDFYKRDPNVEGDFHRPALLPDGRSLLFVVDHVDAGADTIGLLSNGTRKDVLTIKGDVLDSPVYSPTGHILYHRETTSPGIWALPFSVSRLEATGAPFLVASQGSYPAISSNGTLIYAENSVSGLSTLAWVNIRSGDVTSALHEQFQSMSQPRLSPNGANVAAVVQSPGEGPIVIVADVQRRTHVRIDTRASNTSRPAWRDDRTVVYARSDGLRQEIVSRAADGSGGETVLTLGMQPFVRAGRLVFTRLAPGTGGNLHHMLLPPGVAEAGPAEMLQELPEHEWQPALSPDGTLLAYTRGDQGQSEVILRTYPKQTAQWQVSSAGGSFAVWSPLGDAIYYRTISGEIMRVEVRSSPSLALGVPQPLQRPSTLLARGGYDISADGTRLLMVQEVKTDDARVASVAVVQNWFAAFRR